MFRRTCVLLGALVCAAMPSVVCAQASKPIVAVVRIDDLARSGQADTLSAMIESAVAETGRFRLMERQRMGQLVGEQARARGGVVTSATPGRTGGFEGVDYLVYGTITALSAKSGADAAGNLMAGLLGNKNPGCTQTTATLSLDIKITDADSGEIRYVNHLDEKQGNSECGGRAQIDAGALMRSASQKIATGLVTSIYPIQVAAVQPDGTVVLNYGEGSVVPGAVMALYAKGQEIRDPTTGEVLGADETRLGLVRITAVTGRTSRAAPASTFGGPIPVGALARPATKDEQRLATRK